MTAEEQELREVQNRRIRRVKRFLRPLPRKTNIHRYPVLSLFADFAKKRAYLWNFRLDHAIPAIYAGCILTCLPLYGMQLPLALFVAVWLRANLPILAGFQIISNPFTVVPLWFALYQVGRSCLSLVGLDSQPLRRSEVRVLIDNFNSGDWSSNLDRIFSVLGITTVGGIVVGTFLGVLLAFIYKQAALRTSNSYEKIRQKIETKRSQKSS